MATKSRLTGELIVNKLQEAEVLLNQGKPQKAVFKSLQNSKQSHDHWRKEFGGLAGHP
jgi:hypothetical protein